MAIIAVHIAGEDLHGRIMPGDDDWQPAALRAVQRRFGKAASVWAWTLDCWQEDRAGNRTRACFKGTVVGKENSRRHGGGHPILAEARVWVS